MFLGLNNAAGRVGTASRRSDGRKQVSAGVAKCILLACIHLFHSLSSTPRADERSHCAAPRSFYSNRTPSNRTPLRER